MVHGRMASDAAATCPLAWASDQSFDRPNYLHRWDAAGRCEPILVLAQTSEALCTSTSECTVSAPLSGKIVLASSCLRRCPDQAFEKEAGEHARSE